MQNAHGVKASKQGGCRGLPGRDRLRKGRRGLLAWTVFAALFTSALCATADEPRETPAYREMVRADQLRTAGRTRSAIARYQASASLFETIQRDFPDYKPATIAFRLAYCRDQVQRLEAGDATGADEPDYEAIAAAARAESERWQAEAARLATHVAEVESAPEDPRLREQAQRIRELESEIGRVTRRMERLEQQAERQTRRTRSVAETPEPAPAETALPQPAAEPAPVLPGEIEPQRDVEADLAAAEQALQAGDTVTAHALFSAVWTADPDAYTGGGFLRRRPGGGDPRPRYGLARACFADGDYREATRLAESLERDHPEEAAYPHLLGQIARRRQRHSTAARHFTRAVERAPMNFAYRFDLATSLHAASRRNDAMEQYRALVAIDPEHGLSHFNLASLLAAQGEEHLPEARAHYEQALGLGEAPDANLEQRLQP